MTCPAGDRLSREVGHGYDVLPADLGRSESHHLVGTILVPEYALTIGAFTFVGEALLIVWLFLRAIKGFPSVSETGRGQVGEPTPA